MRSKVNESINLVGECEKRPSPLGSDKSALLLRVAAIANALGEDRIEASAMQLAERITQGRFYVACIGQFKRGKSTLLDALVGEPVLPTGVVPVTSVPTVIRYGEAKSARVLIAKRWREIPVSELVQYVSEELNPENKKEVEGAEVFLPSPLLNTGMCLVDTPGIGSVFAGNTASTKSFIPQIDAVLAVVGADPPLSGEELSLLQTVAEQTEELIVVLNKSDRVSESERAAAVEFTYRTIETRLKTTLSDIYEVSALERLRGDDGRRDWDKLVNRLNLLAANAGKDLTTSAGDRGLRRLSEALLRALDERRRALLDPIQVSEQRIATMRSTAAQAEQSLRDLGALFAAEQSRLSEVFRRRRKEFLRRIDELAHRELDEAIPGIPVRSGPRYRRAANAVAQEIARKHVLPWMKDEEAYAEERYADAMTRFLELADGFLRRLQGLGLREHAEELGPRWEDFREFSSRSEFRFYDFINLAQPPSPIRKLVDFTLVGVGITTIIRKDAHSFLDRLLEANTSRVQFDCEERVVKSRQRLETAIRALLRELCELAARALEHARKVQAEGSTAVQSTLAEQEKLTQELVTFLKLSAEH